MGYSRYNNDVLESYYIVLNIFTIHRPRKISLNHQVLFQEFCM